jgi:hypothetical protein
MVGQKRDLHPEERGDLLADGPTLRPGNGKIDFSQECLAPHPKERREDGVPILVVVVNSAYGDAGPTRNVLDMGRVEPLGGEYAFRGVGDGQGCLPPHPLA